MRIGVFTAFVLLAAGAASWAQAQQADFSGRWSLSGLIMSRASAYSFAQICDLKQTGDQIAGPCHGPNGACSLVGVVNGANLDLTCRTTATNNPSLAGVLTLHGALGADAMVRGKCDHSSAPGFGGVFAMMRI